MSRYKDILLKQHARLQEKNLGETAHLLKRAWKDLPPDFTMGERSLFIELAERLIHLSDVRKNIAN